MGKLLSYFFYLIFIGITINLYMYYLHCLVFDIYGKTTTRRKITKQINEKEKRNKNISKLGGRR